MHEHEAWFGCGRREAAAAARVREPFALPGTERRYAPDREADVKHTRLEVRLDPAVVRVEGTVHHTVAALTQGVERVRLHAAELSIGSVRGPNGKDLPFRHEGAVLEVELPKRLALGDEATLSITYQGTPRRGLWFVGPDAGYPKKPHQVWSQGQDEDSRYWFPCFDHPVEKATTEVLARVPSKYHAIGNGALQGKKEHGDGTTTWHWKQAIPHSAYLVSLVVGEFEEVVLEGGPVPLTAYVPKGKRKEAERAFGRTAEMIRVFEERFGTPYPYEKYAQVVVHDFVFGGMENTSATTLLEQALYDDRAALDEDMDDLIAHELAHQWWGDLLTCRDWSHAWLNEGFATWAEGIFKEAHEGKDEAAWSRRVDLQAYMDEDSGAYRRAIVDPRYEEPIALFDRHLYEKGSLVLHALRRELGEEPFWRSIRAYAQENRARGVVTDDLRRAIETSTGRNLEWFFDQWIHRGGYPEVTVGWSYDVPKAALTVTVRQGQAADDLTPEAFRFTAEVDVVHGKTSVRHRLDVRRREHSFLIPLEKAPDAVRFDPDGDLLAAVTIDRPPDQQRKILADDPSVIARARAAEALAKDPTSATVEALAKALHDPFWGVGSEAARSLGRIRTPAARDALLAGLGSVKHPKARRSVARNLGPFRHDEKAAAALERVLEKGDPSIFVEAMAAQGLGETRVPSGRKVLERALATKDSWAETIRSSCVRGLALFADEAVVPTLLDAFRYGKPARVRVAAAGALAEVGRRLLVRDPIREALQDGLRDRGYLTTLASADALAALGDERAVGALSAAAAETPDGRLKRSCQAAVRRLRQSGSRPQEVARLADEVDALKKRAAELLQRVELLEKPAAAKKPKKPRKAPRKRKGR